MKYTKRQKEIIDTSVKLIASGGIQNLTMKNIAEGIGVTEPAVYRHFKSKLDILEALLENFLRAGAYNLSESEFAGATSGLEKLRKNFTAHLEVFSKRPEIAAVIFSEEIFRDEKQLSETLFKFMENNRVNVIGMISKAVTDGEMRGDIPPDMAATMIMGSLRLLVKRWSLSGGVFDLKAEGKRLWDALDRLLSP